jgi:hypothetical protein
MPMRRAPLAAVSRFAAIARFDLGLGNLHVVVRAGVPSAHTPYLYVRIHTTSGWPKPCPCRHSHAPWPSRVHEFEMLSAIA